MHISHHVPAQQHSALDAVRSLAKRLHRAATSESLASSLPVLRRILASHTLNGMSLSQLYRRRAMLQRKHVLRMLAVESGFPAWEDYSHALKAMAEDQLAHFDVHRDKAGHLNLWFSSRAEAEAHAAATGGRVIGVGGQAVLLTDGLNVDPLPQGLHGNAR